LKTKIKITITVIKIVHILQHFKMKKGTDRHDYHSVQIHFIAVAISSVSNRPVH